VVRRRTRRHSRNRRIRQALLITFGAVAVLSFSLIALRYLAPTLFRTAAHASDVDATDRAAQNTLDLFQQESARSLARRPVYPYSIVSGGVRNVQELRSAAQQDPVVGLHYAGFDYAHARVVQLLSERFAYVSYRIGNRVYWTRHRVKLHKGEAVLTDGKMTARIRCANRVEEKPQQESSRMEPPAAQFDAPVMPAIGTVLQNPSLPFQSSLERAALGPAPPLGVYDPIGGGSWTPLAPPPLPRVCGIEGKKKPGASGTSVPVMTANGKNKKVVDVCGGGGSSEVPEPGTWVLVGSGMTALLWMARRRLRSGLLVQTTDRA
jgi:hypothetical protein